MNSWSNWAINIIESDYQRSADTHLLKLNLPCSCDIDMYLKDESTHVTGSLKHRLARSLFLYTICNGYINENTPIIESSSGSTAISEAYFAQLLNLPFIAVIPKNTAIQKIKDIEFFNGTCHLVDSCDLYTAAHQLAKELNGYYMDQFTFAERATDWRGNNNIAESIFTQMSKEKYSQPDYIVTGAGTGGTSATIGRFIKYKQYDTKLYVVDPENSVFYDYYHQHDPSIIHHKQSKIEGIGRPRVEKSFIRHNIDGMFKVADPASIAAMNWLSSQLNKKVGASTGTNMIGVFQLAYTMLKNKQKGSIITLLCDSGERYDNTYYNDTWCKENIDMNEYHRYVKKIEDFTTTGHSDGDFIITK